MHMTQEGILPPLCLAQKYKPVKFFLIQSAIQTASNDGLQPDEQGSEVGVTCDEEKSDGEQDVVTAGNRLKEIRNRHDTNSEAVSELVGKQGQNGADRRQKSAKKSVTERSGLNPNFPTACKPQQPSSPLALPTFWASFRSLRGQPATGHRKFTG